MEAEFKIGDTVHFRAYKYQAGQGLEAKIKKIVTGADGKGGFFNGEADDRIYYAISGPKIISRTTGKNLIESTLYQEPTE